MRVEVADKGNSKLVMDGLTGIRAVAALWVVLFHFNGVSLAPIHLDHYLPAIDYGYLGVDLFFLLSGFIITHVHGSDFVALRSGPVLRFYALRLARLYPVHLAVLAGLVMMYFAGTYLGFLPHYPQLFSLDQFAMSLGLVQAWRYGIVGWNGPSWSISAEWFVYLLFPLLALAINRVRGRAIALWLAIAVMLFALAYVYLFGGVLDCPSGSLALLRVSFEFSMGALLYKAVQSRDLSRLPWAAIVVALLVLAVWSAPAWRGFILVMAFACAIVAGRYDDNLLARALAAPAVVYLGEISYSLYMVHMPFQMTAGKLATLLLERHGRSVAFDLTVTLLTLAALIAAAAAMYHLVERPARRWLRTRIPELDKKSLAGRRPAREVSTAA